MNNVDLNFKLYGYVDISDLEKKQKLKYYICVFDNVYVRDCILLTNKRRNLRVSYSTINF